MGVFSGPKISSDSPYIYHIATSSGVFTPNFTGNVEVLVVAGGGGGGMDMGGGGGGGGVISNTTYSVSTGSPITVTVGAGGVGAPAGGPPLNSRTHQFIISATNGSNSVFGSLTAVGGGYGGSSYFGYTPNYGYGNSGGSGGGASGYSDGSGGHNGSGTSGQGNAGGASIGQYYSGGGGGAGTAGSNSTYPNGGDGVLNAILGKVYYWGGGGGGASYSSYYGGQGGKGGGGGGAPGYDGNYGKGDTNGINPGKNAGNGPGGSWTHVPGGDGGKYTGGGGGGGMHYCTNNRGGNGGSGVVIIRHLKSLGTSTFNGGHISQSSLLFSLDASTSGKSVVEVLVVAGGGGGGMDMGGGGGAGLAVQTTYTVSTNEPISVTIGAGGAGSPGPYAGPPPVGSNGSDTIFGLIKMKGGGGGGSGHYYPYPYAGVQGQDGGNAGGDSPLWGRNRGNGQTSSYGGYEGGAATVYTDGWYCPGGGGGNSRPGGGGRYVHVGGPGGDGLYSAINGTGYYWGGGGGGAGHTNGAGNGGAGGGGGGSDYVGGTAGTGGSGLNAGANGTVGGSANGGNAGTNTGGGGGGSSHSSGVGGNGASGIVIVRYYGSQKATGGTITSSGGYTVHTFTSSGTFTPTEWIGGADGSTYRIPTTFVGTTYSTSNGGSYIFNGSSDYIDLRGDQVFKTTGGHTVENWFKLDAVVSGNLYNFIGASSVDYHSWYWTVYTSRLAIWNVSPGGWYYGSTTIQPSVWYQAVMVTDDAGTGIKFYLNGVAEGGTHASYSFNSSYSGLKIGYIGRGDAPNARYFYGSMPVTRVYDRALSASEVQQNFQALRGRFGI